MPFNSIHRAFFPFTHNSPGSSPGSCALRGRPSGRLRGRAPRTFEVSLLRRSAGILAFTASSLLASTALAEDFNPQSRIGAVTVFPEGAEITRQAALEMPAGAHRIVFEKLPDGIRPNDVRVEGLADGNLVIQAVDVARVPVTGDPAQTNALRKEREELGDNKELLEGRIRTAEVQRQMIMMLVRPPAVPKDVALAQPPMPPDQLFAFIAERHAEIEETIRKAQQDIRDIDRRIAEIDRELSRTSGEREWASRITVSVNAQGDVQGKLRLRYRLRDASWQPVYDARLDTSAETAKLQLTQRAMVRQHTGEDWNGVALTLATARPQGSTAAPDAQVRYVGFARPVPRERAMGGALYDDRSASAEVAAPAPEPEAVMRKEMEESRAAVTDLGFDAVYSVPGLADIPATDDSRLVLVGDHDVDSKMEARIVPAVREAAFLTVSFSHKGAAPLPPGTVRLFRDGVFVGEGHLPLANPGQKTELGFGIDERIEVTRRLVSKQRGEEGIFSRARTDTNDWRTVIANHHSVPIDVVVLESLPQTLDEKINVSPLSTNDPADESDVDGKSGVQAWRFTLDAQGERTLAFGYRIDWPQGQNVVLGMR